MGQHSYADLFPGQAAQAKTEMKSALNNQLSDFWSEVANTVKGTTDKLDKSSDTVAKATDTANKAINMASSMVSMAKPVMIVVGTVLGILCLQEIYLNFREIAKGGK